MTREEATRELTSDAPHTRLQAARLLGRIGSPSDVTVLRRALQKETVSFVRRALETAIARAGSTHVDSGGEEPQDELPPDPRLYSRAVEWATATLLHEISPRLGEAKLAARRSVPNYEASDLKRRFDALDGILEAIGELQQASRSEAVTSVNLYGLIEEVWAEESLRNSCTLSAQGPLDSTATVDRNRLRLAICNGLRNAMEVTVEAGRQDPIVATWGMTDVEFWITILDHGPGLASPAEAAFKIGSTTKVGHRGFGLAIVQQAMMTLGGTVNLSPGASGGARFELRWPR